MSTTYLVVTVLGALMAVFSAVSIFIKAKWVVEPLAAYRVPRTWWTWLGVAKAAGAVGLVVGLVVPVVGTIAAIGLIAYFTGAVVTVLRARWFAHVPFPLVYMAPVVASLLLAG